MTESLNLTLKRGPSVWDTPPDKGLSSWRVAAVTGGALVAAAALQSRSSRRGWLLALGVASVVCGFVGDRLTSTVQARARHLRIVGRPQPDHVVDRASEDSFPASDPPALA